jgi:uncharacterized protein (TIGR02453 family)
MPSPHSFRPALFRFLRELAANNNREWFAEHKGEYEDVVRGPAMEFIAACQPLLHEISPHLVADPRKVGGSLFRIHRDVRFSKDKSPYKTSTGIQFRHEAGRDAHAPGFYLHLEPGQVFVGLGMWHPDPETAQRVRAAILADGAGWKRASRGKRFTEHFELAGESYKRPPAGVPREHPLLEDLLRKDFIATTRLKDNDVTGADFPRTCMGLCGRGKAFMQFLCQAIGVDF